MATRLYLPSSGAAPVSPAIDAGWEHIADLVRAKMVTTRISSAMGAAAFTDEGIHGSNSSDTVLRQYVSDPISAQTIAAQTVKCQIRASETATTNNLMLTWLVKVVSNDGSTVRGTVVAIRREATEFAASLTNRTGTVTSSEVVSQSGDRIVLEIGHGGTTGALGGHNGTISIGDDSGSDLAEDESTTTANNPWLEFANTLSWYSTRTAAGSQPAATGTVAQSAGSSFSRSVAGAQAAASGTVSRILQAVRAVTGSQPAASGTVAAVRIFARTVEGVQAAATGTVTRILQAVRTVTGSQPAATGVIYFVLVPWAGLRRMRAVITDTLGNIKGHLLP